MGIVGIEISVYDDEQCHATHDADCMPTVFTVFDAIWDYEMEGVVPD